MPTKQRARPRIGLVSSSLIGYLHKDILAGAVAVAEEQNADVIAWACGPMNPPSPFLAMRNALYNVMDPSCIDGLIVPISSLGRFVGPETYLKYLERFSSIPVVSIGVNGYGFPTVRVDYAHGMKEMVRHLVTVHGRQRLAFVRGPDGHQSSAIRFEAYRETLAELGLPYDESLVVTVDMLQLVGVRAVDVLLQRGINFDAVVTINDTKALEEMACLQAHDLRVPDDVAVVGYQDIPDGLLVEPSLTTVSEQMIRQGRLAAELLLDRIAGREVSQVSTLDTTMIVRESCGCTARLNRQSDSLTGALGSVDCHHLFTSLRQGVRSLQGVSTGTREDLEGIVYALAQETHGQEGRFAQALSRVVRNIEERSAIRSAMRIREFVNIFRSLGYRLVSTFNFSDIIREIGTATGMRECYIVLYDHDAPPFSRGRLLISFQNGQTVRHDLDGESFPCSQLIPDGVRTISAPARFLVEELFYDQEHLGYIVMDYIREDGTLYEALHAQISGALKTELRVKELEAAEQRFHDIAHSSSDWLWEMDSSLRFTYCSDGVEKLLGYSPAEMQDKSWFDILQPGQPELKRQIKQVVESGNAFSDIECWASHQDGYPVACTFSGTPITGKGESPLGYRGVSRNITRQLEVQKRLNHLAYYDLLTELPNRSLFQDRLEMAVANAQRYRERLALFFMDLNGFKQVNDQLGHDAGDLALKEAAQRLRSVTRETDTLSRLGGDEFVLILQHLRGQESARFMATKITQAFEPPFLIEGREFSIGISIGIAMYPLHGRDPATLLRLADIAMYRSKETGGQKAFLHDDP